MNLTCGTPEQLLIGADTAQATWPESCRYDIGIYIDKRDWPGDERMGIELDNFNDTFEAACGEWNSSIGLNFYLETSRADARCYVDFAALSGSTLAWSNLANNSCLGDKRQRYDIRSWGTHTLFLTVVHELGHLLGLGHSSTGIMTPTINTNLSGVTSADINRAKRLGYGDPQKPAPPIPPKPRPEPNPDYDYNKLAQSLLNGGLLERMNESGLFVGARGPSGLDGRPGATGPQGRQGPPGDVNMNQLMETRKLTAALGDVVADTAFRRVVREEIRDIADNLRKEPDES